MKLIVIAVFSTLVFTQTLWAAKTESVEMAVPESEAKNSAENMEAFSISEAPPLPPYEAPPKEFVFMPDKSIYLRAGQYTFWDESETYHPIGLTFIDYHRDMDASEYGFDVKAGLGRLLFGKKYYFNMAKRIRPFYKWTLGLNLDPDDGLANIVDYKKYMLGLGIGSEISFTQISAFRFEADFFRSKEDSIIQIMAGYLYSW